MAVVVRTREHREAMVGRVQLLALLLAGGMVFVLTSYWFVQGVQGGQFRQLAENNRLRELALQAPRGIVEDRDGRPLAENIPSYSLRLDRSAVVDLEESLAFAALQLDESVVTLRSRLEADRDHARRTARLAGGLTLEQVAHFEAVALEHPEFETGVEDLRIYRHREQTAHVLGYLGEVNAEELANPDLGVQSGELVGRRGIERRYQSHLRGERGERVVIVDNRGRPVGEYDEELPRAGRDLRLTLDLDLQQTAHQALRDKVGAIVVLQPRTGEVLAMVSSPSYDPNLFARRLDPVAWQTLIDHADHPLQNRVLQSAYPPGSIFKIVMGLGGLQEGIVSASDRVYCGGSKEYYGRRFRCWKRSGHGWVDLQRAIQYSCDIYFYDLGQEMGVERIAEHARRFGLGEPTGIDLHGERSGLVPSLRWSREQRGHPWYPGETISLSIGQGPILTTPLQVAVLTAASATQGVLPVPWLAQPGETSRPSADYARSSWQLMSQALLDVVEGKDGTGSEVRLEGLSIAGKTGTVQVVTQSTWVRSEDLPLAERDHAWFTSYAPAEDPRLVVVVFVEHGGAGSRAAAPIAREIYATAVEKYSDLRDL